MRATTNVVVTGKRAVLVPYRREHVARYHEWMVSGHVANGGRGGHARPWPGHTGLGSAVWGFHVTSRSKLGEEPQQRVACGCSNCNRLAVQQDPELQEATASEPLTLEVRTSPDARYLLLELRYDMPLQGAGHQWRAVGPCYLASRRNSM